MSDAGAANHGTAGAARSRRWVDYDRLARSDLEAAVWSPIGERRRSDFDLMEPAARAQAAARPRALRPAAVLCPVVPRDGRLQVVLTLRAATLKNHAGQVSFPGGKVDPEDPSPLAAALREAAEEIGLTSDLVEVLGAIDPYETGTGFLVTPFVGIVSPSFHPIAEESEVAEVFETPLGFLMNPANHQRLTKPAMGPGPRRRFYAMPWRDPAGRTRFIWGATAGMLRNLSDRMHESEPLAAAQ